MLAYVDEQGIAPLAVSTSSARPDVFDEDEADAAFTDVEADEAEIVAPGAVVYVRDSSGTAPTLLGEHRLAYEAWQPVPTGDVSVLNDLPRLTAKQKLRAVVSEIVEAEGPAHMDRLAQLVAGSFGLHKVHPARAKKIAYQIKASGLHVDKAKFVWPSDVDPAKWNAFRPNTSQTDRPFPFISPVEIANAMRFFKRQNPNITDVELDSAVLRTFGRRRRTQQFTAHLAKAKLLLKPPNQPSHGLLCA